MLSGLEGGVSDLRGGAGRFGLAAGLGLTALNSLLSPRLFAAPQDTKKSVGAVNPLDFAPKAKRVIYLYQAGGPSHLETWDPKPLLNKLDGKKRPAEFGDVKYQNVNSASRILGTKRTFQKYGQSGIEVSDLFPHQAKVVD